MANFMGTTFVIAAIGGVKLIGVSASTYATADTLDLDAAGASVTTIKGFCYGNGQQAATAFIGSFASNRITASSAGSSVWLLVWGV